VAEEPKQPAAAAEIAAADLEIDQDDILQRRRSRDAQSGGLRWWLVVALLIGVAVGAWLAGRYVGTPEAAPPVATPSGSPAAGSGHMMPGMGQSAEELEARKAELVQQLADQPGNIDALFELAQINIGLELADQARDNWLEITTLDPEQSLAWYNLGFYYLSVEPQDKAAAKAALERVIAIGPADSALVSNAKSHLQAIDNPAASFAQD